VVPAAISLGLSGIGFWHSDAGGATTLAWKKRSRECLERWMEMSAFTPFFRSHEGNRPDANAQFHSDAETLRLLARMTEIFAALKPYHLAAAAEYVDRGHPPIRHPWIHYWDDPVVHRLAYQYLYGRDLMVAPTVSSGTALTELYLPEDEWVHLWTSRRFRGGRITIDSPRGCPAVFYRGSSPFAELFDAIRRTISRAY
jgi:alpha-glucosidase